MDEFLFWFLETWSRWSAHQWFFFFSLSLELWATNMAGHFSPVKNFSLDVNVNGLVCWQYLEDQKPHFFVPLTSFNQFWLMTSFRHFRTAGDPSSLSSVQLLSWALWSSPKVWTWLKACLCESLRSLWAHLGLGQTWMPNNGIVAINFLNICGPWCLQFWPIQYRMKSLSCGGHPSDSIVVSEGRKGRQKKLHNKMTYSAANDDLYDSTLCQIEFGIYWRQLQDRSQYSHSAWQM